LLYATRHNHGESHRFFVQHVQVEEAKRENVFLLLSEREKLRYMQETERSIHEFISHSVAAMRGDEKALEGTLNAWLQWKGAVMEAQGKHLEAVVASGNEDIKNVFDELTQVRREITRLQRTWRPDTAFAEVGKLLVVSEGRKEELEARLSSMSHAFSISKRSDRADQRSISRLLPNDSAYLDFARIHSYDFDKKIWDKPRYVVFVLRPGENPALALVDLGDAETVDRHVGDYLKAMSSARTGFVPSKKALDAASTQLYTLLFRPIEQLLVGRQHLFISPDGNLNLIPFEILQDDKGAYPMDSARISYVAAGRDIARFEDQESIRTGAMALILADPNYDFGLSEDEIRRSRDQGQDGSAVPAKAYELSYFARLPHTREEAEKIQQILTERMHIPVTNYLDDKALESVLQTVEPPSIMHLATHGYFIAREEVEQGSPVLDPGQTLLRDNPMLRSGLALTGVNLSLREGRDEGVFSAAKVMGLQLIGTDLVVLSACETGLGDVQSGEGVFGLKRAFILSGAKAVVLSLWSVPSKETMELMTTFYTLWADGKSKAEALRLAKLEMKNKKANPFFWGAFILVGNPE